MQEQEQKHDYTLDKEDKYLTSPKFDDTTKTPIVSIISQINPKNNRYPYCIVWTSIPCISHLLPFIGHTGICT